MTNIRPIAGGDTERIIDRREHDEATCTHRCGCVLAHEPAQALADLLKAAVAVDEIATTICNRADVTVEESRRFDALRAAVRRLV